MNDIPHIFDQDLLRRRARRALALGPATFLLDRIIADLGERLDAVLRHFAVAADLGTPSTAAATMLAARAAPPDLVLHLDPLAAAGVGEAPLPACARPVAADLAALPLRAESLDLAVSVLALHFVDDLPGTLAQVRQALKPDGLFIGALAGGDTLTELRQSFAAAEAETIGGASPRVVPFIDMRVAGQLLQRAGFALPVTDVERITVRYANAFALFDDLRRMGATNPLTARRRQPLRRATLMRVAEIYAERFSDADGRLRTTFDIVWLAGWAPHTRQQQPLAPGSAKMRLAEALGAREQSAGEKAGR